MQAHTVPLVFKQNTSTLYDVKVCRICFASDCNLYLMTKYKSLDQAYEILTGIQIKSNDNVPPYLCVECSYRLQNCVQFRTRSIEANIALQDIIHKNCYLTLEAIKSFSGYQLFSSKLRIAHKPANHCDLEMEHVETEIVCKNREDLHEPYAINLIKVENDDQNNTHSQDNTNPPSMHEVTVPGIKIENDDVYNKDNIKCEKTNEGYREDFHSTEIEIKVEAIEANNEDSSDDNCTINASDHIPDVGKNYSSDKLHLEDQKKSSYRSSNIIPEIKDHSCHYKDFEGRRKKYDRELLSDACSYKINNESQSKIKILTGTNSKTCFNKKLHPCDICKKNFSHRYHLNTHLRTHAGIRPYICDVCNKEFNLKYDLVNHLRKHTGEKPYVCNICNKTFILRNVLQTHMRTHTGERPYSCGVCDKAFSQRANLIAHSKTHSGEKPYSCDVCNKAFSQRCNLLTHYRTHSGEKPFSCNICMTSFSRNYQLKGHMTIHSGEKPFTCNVCSKSFNSQSNLQEHVAIHSGVKPFSCDICKKAFNRKGNLNIHIKTHSDDKPFPCTVCNKAFRRKDQLKNHLRVHLAETPVEVNVKF